MIDQTQEQVEKAKEKGLPFYQIKCDVCGYVATAMIAGSSNFDFCDGHSGRFIDIEGISEPFEVNCRGFNYDADLGVMVSNYEVRELTGIDTEGVTGITEEWCRFTRLPEL